MINSIGIIGAGRVGGALSLLLREKGFNISGVYSKSLSSAEKLALKINSFVYRDLESLVAESELIFITTPDREIARVAREIAKIPNLKGKYFAHTSGSQCYKILSPIKEKGGITFTMHPLQAIASPEMGRQVMPEAYFSLEGDPEGVELGAYLVRVLGAKVLYLKENQKSLYHAGAVVASNYLVTLIDIALELLEISGIDREEGYRALKPLILGTLNNIEKYGTVNALTGPIARGDTVTIEQHLEKLREYPKLREFYRVLGRHTLEMAQKREDYNPEKGQEILKLFEGEKSNG
ncbi:Rossmann-like and DUF2520 domain-containing protein [Carboxydothermus ferrireducens]|uniref:Short-subunit dehydrogenase-like oxidoreductase (DUF2520 family) n=1 Tax=Carboxydothermus ferrireducens DSM 11255 TaxID=1119529 RepID=A0ABX2R9N1_9THEO|nr:Rossmann-like and DUF2520 domain-containing protein [Carboxydothermus ferrireducens]NYE57888.1 putative short-subunit dehydrogenase-like oxidoreductase (DUF2520 family) [Carboxydothermus ferrireducens DSM 11255]